MRNFSFQVLVFVLEVDRVKYGLVREGQGKAVFRGTCDFAI